MYLATSTLEMQRPSLRLAQISFEVHPAHPAGEEAEAAAGLAAEEEAVRVAGPGTSGPAATGTVGAHTRGGCNIGAGAKPHSGKMTVEVAMGVHLSPCLHQKLATGDTYDLGWAV